MGDLRVVRQPTGSTDETVSKPHSILGKACRGARVLGHKLLFINSLWGYVRAHLYKKPGLADLDEIGYGIEGQAHEK